jgi:hypothetical protein
VILRSQITVDRAADQVYEIVAGRLFETYHLWNTGVLEVRALTPGPVRKGSRGVALEFVRRGKNAYREEGCAFEVAGLMDGAGLVLEQSDPHFAIDRSRLTLLFEPRREKTRVRLTEEMVWGNDWVGFARPFVWMRRKRDRRRDLRRLKKALEAKELPPPPGRKA